MQYYLVLLKLQMNYINYMSEVFLNKLSDPWLIVGLIGQLLFFSRFVIQWIASERAKSSVMPPVFWYLSLVGSGFLLAYSYHISDPIFLVASVLNIFIYLRNIALINNKIG